MKLVYPPRDNSIVWPQYKIFIPYTDILPATLICLIGYNYTPVKMEDKYSYSSYFKERWQEKQKFISIEQDMLIWPGAIEAIWDCPEPLCTYDLSLPNHRMRKIDSTTGSIPPGCIKFSVQSIESTPDLWDNPIEWNIVDQHLTKIKTSVHQHYPSIVNANPALMGFVNYEEV